MVVVPIGKRLPPGIPLQVIWIVPEQLSLAVAWPRMASFTATPQEVAPKPVTEKRLRFADEILPSAPPKPLTKDKKKKARGKKESAEDGIRLKKKRRGATQVFEDEGEEYF